MSVADHRYLIICGAPKAGTTSLFTYLAGHPQICGAALKETRFFIDTDYPLASSARFDGTNIERYGEFYKQCSVDREQVRLEATPDYLYSRQALQIAQLLPNAKIVFILRDPIERLVSYYKYSKQLCFIDNTVSFSEYVQMQMNSEIANSTPIHLRALEHGQYERYLPAFRNEFPGRMMEVAFDELRDRPDAVLKRICEFSAIEAGYFERHHFSIENESFAVRNQYVQRLYYSLLIKLSHYFHNKPTALACLRLPNKLIKQLLSANKTTTEKVGVDSAIREYLANYYRGHYKKNANE